MSDVLEEREDRTDFIRIAVERELDRREAGQDATAREGRRLYKITDKELDSIAQQIESLRDLVRAIGDKQVPLGAGEAEEDVAP